jgi:hypothetical protein
MAAAADAAGHRRRLYRRRRRCRRRCLDVNDLVDDEVKVVEVEEVGDHDRHVDDDHGRHDQPALPGMLVPNMMMMFFFIIGSREE